MTPPCASPTPAASWQNGVTIFRPETCVIDAEVNVGPDTVIEPYVQLLGRTTIGSDSRIRSYSVITNTTIGDGVIVLNGCIFDNSEVADNAVLGPYARLRPESRIGEAVHLGNFVETKKTTIGKGSKANHLSYLGDAIIGERVNIGAGTITCNYDGVHKHPTTIGDGAFIGSDSNLVAPITIGERSLRRRWQYHHRRRPRRRTSPGPQPAGHQTRLGRCKKSRANENPKQKLLTALP